MAAAGGIAALSRAQDRLDGAEEELQAAKAAVQKAESEVPLDAPRVAKAELGVAKAELGVAKAELGVAEAKWVAALEEQKATLEESVKTAQKSIESAQKIVNAATKAYERALDAAAPPHGADDGGALVGPLEAFLKEQQERDERQRKEQLQMLRHLARPENPCAEMARTSAVSDTSSQQNFRTRLSTFYGHGDSQKPKCIVTGVEDAPDSFRVVAAHIWPRSAAETFPFKTLENGVNNPSNGMFLHQAIEQDMDRLRVCFVCDPFQFSAKFVVLHKGILEQNLQGTTVKYNDLQFKELKFTNEQRPSFQLLSKHAQQAFNHSGNDLSMNEQEVECLKAVLQVGSPQKPGA